MSSADGTAHAKDELRGQLLGARRLRPDADRDRARAAVRHHVLERCAVARWRCVAAYEPLRTEPGSTELLGGLRDLGVRVLVPLTLPDRDLDWLAWGSGQPLGRDEIAAADVVLVPALAVAADGTRLGRGGGSYDRALARCATGTTIAALLFDGEEPAALPRASWDLPVTDVVTPSGWRPVRGNTGVANPG